MEAGLQICPSGWTTLDHESLGRAQIPAPVVLQVVACPSGGTLRHRLRLESDPGFVGIVYLKIVVSQAYFTCLRLDCDNVAAGPAGTIAEPDVSFVEHGNLCTHMLLGERVAQFQTRIRGSFGCHDAQTCDVVSGSFSSVEVGRWMEDMWMFGKRSGYICQACLW